VDTFSKTGGIFYLEHPAIQKSPESKHDQRRLDGIVLRQLITILDARIRSLLQFAQLKPYSKPSGVKLVKQCNIEHFSV
jgi:hypothetical protein